MAYINENFLKLKAGYLFPEIARRVSGFQQQNPEKAARLIRCGIGDVTEALPAGHTYSGCNEVRAAGVAPLYSYKPGFSERLDGDGDGIGCEPYRGQ